MQLSRSKVTQNRLNLTNSYAGHRCHDYDLLVRRWKKVARETKLTFEPFAEADGFPLYVARTRTLQADGGCYISAGIHGDEPASTEGLISWAEQNNDHLVNLPLLIFPCLNPWGLLNNVRTDARDRDLNRIFHLPGGAPMMRPWRKIVGKRNFAFCHLLHEDYDALGCYVYEIRSLTPHWGEAMLETARKSSGITPDARTRIEGRVAENGVVRRKLPKKGFPWVPEALYLFWNGNSKRVFTFETPSEFCIEKRTIAHVAALNAVVDLSRVRML